MVAVHSANITVEELTDYKTFVLSAYDVITGERAEYIEQKART